MNTSTAALAASTTNDAATADLFNTICLNLNELDTRLAEMTSASSWYVAGPSAAAAAPKRKQQRSFRAAMIKKTPTNIVYTAAAVAADASIAVDVPDASGAGADHDQQQQQQPLPKKRKAALVAAEKSSRMILGLSATTTTSLSSRQQQQQQSATSYQDGRKHRRKRKRLTPAAAAAAVTVIEEYNPSAAAAAAAPMPSRGSSHYRQRSFSSLLKPTNTTAAASAAKPKYVEYFDNDLLPPIEYEIVLIDGESFKQPINMIVRGIDPCLLEDRHCPMLLHIGEWNYQHLVRWLCRTHDLKYNDNHHLNNPTVCKASHLHRYGERALIEFLFYFNCPVCERDGGGGGGFSSSSSSSSSLCCPAKGFWLPWMVVDRDIRYAKELRDYGININLEMKSHTEQIPVPKQQQQNRRRNKHLSMTTMTAGSSSSSREIARKYYTDHVPCYETCNMESNYIIKCLKKIKNDRGGGGAFQNPDATTAADSAEAAAAAAAVLDVAALNRTAIFKLKQSPEKLGCYLAEILTASPTSLLPQFNVVVVCDQSIWRHDVVPSAAAAAAEFRFFNTVSDMVMAHLEKMQSKLAKQSVEQRDDYFYRQLGGVDHRTFLLGHSGGSSSGSGKQRSRPPPPSSLTVVQKIIAAAAAAGTMTDDDDDGTCSFADALTDYIANSDILSSIALVESKTDYKMPSAAKLIQILYESNVLSRIFTFSVTEPERTAVREAELYERTVICEQRHICEIAGSLFRVQCTECAAALSLPAAVKEYYLQDGAEQIRTPGTCHKCHRGAMVPALKAFNVDSMSTAASIGGGSGSGNSTVEDTIANAHLVLVLGSDALISSSVIVNKFNTCSDNSVHLSSAASIEQVLQSFYKRRSVLEEKK